ncbi:MAG: hypothetical protein GY816_10325 [Cytophagales bacterium]|nr:hypothetical protein [Cytophagales bacterium]
MSKQNPIFVFFDSLMKIDLQEIWNFIELLGAGERGWEFSLEAGIYQVKGIKSETLTLLEKDEGYDTELLPSLFTFREILWQPDVFTEAQMSISPLRVLKAFCDESMEAMDETNEVQNIYLKLLEGMATCCEKAEVEITEGKGKVTDVLGHLRTCTFPIIKFFIYHPMNRLDYRQDAMNRLNYAVKIMLTQFYGQYSELTEPHWIVGQSKPERVKKTDDEK